MCARGRTKAGAEVDTAGPAVGEDADAAPDGADLAGGAPVVEREADDDVLLVGDVPDKEGAFEDICVGKCEAGEEDVRGGDVG